jgi:hypothetical protein
MMHGCEKSDSVIVAEKSPNKTGQPVVEAMERRAEARRTRASNARAGRRTGKACHRRWSVYGKPQGNGRRNGSPRSSTTSRPTCSGCRFLPSSETRRPVQTA